LWHKVLIIFAFSLTGPLTASAVNTELEEFRTEIRVKYDMKEAAFAANDPEPILNRFYHPEVVSTGPDGVTHLGRDGLRPVYNEIIGSDVRIESYRTFVAGDAGWDWVNFHVTPPVEAHEEPFTFKLLFLWARENGEWWSHGEMYVVGKFDTIGIERK
jgi:hypothetical protein